jgi:hypothetical protein
MNQTILGLLVSVFASSCGGGDRLPAGTTPLKIETAGEGLSYFVNEVVSDRSVDWALLEGS